MNMSLRETFAWIWKIFARLFVGDATSKKEKMDPGDEMPRWFLVYCMTTMVFTTIFYFYGPLWRKKREAGKVKGQDDEPLLKLMICLGSGGHTTEMLNLVKPLDKGVWSSRIYVVPKNDILSAEHLWNKVEVFTRNRDFTVERMHRIREVGQNIISTLFYDMPMSFINAWQIIRKYKPSCLLVNGPGFCIPLVIMAKIHQVLFRSYCHVTFVESVCRVRSFSLTGKILLPFVNDVFVQWQEMEEVPGLFSTISNLIFGNLRPGYLGRIS